MKHFEMGRDVVGVFKVEELTRKMPKLGDEAMRLYEMGRDIVNLFIVI